MAETIDLYINHVLMVGVEWDTTTEEVLGGTGRCTFTLQDRNLTLNPKAHQDVKVIISSSGHVLFRGEIISVSVDYEMKLGYRRWKLDCADYNNELPQRKVGAFDGKTWEDPDGLGFYVNVDRWASSLKTDKKTVQRLFSHYIRVDGESIDTSEYVNKYLDDFETIFWSYSDLQAALEDMAALITENLQFWIDPDLKFHWVTIPAWYDILQEEAALAEDDTLATLASMLPQGAGQFDIAPAGISDSNHGDSGWIGGRGLRFTYDGSAMPEQIYVRGATGFTYNAGSIDPDGDTKQINPQGYGAKASEVYRLTFNSSTKIWSKNDDGLITASFTTVPASGPYKVKFVRIPWNAADHKGGHYWKLISGPHKGKYVDNDTNYFNYGDITVEKWTAVVTPPKVGVGGSGWVKNVDQDPNKRQAYLEAPISDSQKIRDAIGKQALYRAKHPTLRASITVSGVDGWRAGQIVFIRDARLPAELNNRYFIIQRVACKLIPAQDVREYTLDFGDGPTSRWSMQQKKPAGDGLLPEPATQIIISVFDLSPGINSTQVITGQLANRAGGPWHIAGKVVKWSMEAYDSNGVRVQEGSISPKVSITDSHGRARTKLKTGPTPGTVFYVFADVNNS